MALDTLNMIPVENRNELISWFEKGNKSDKSLKIGTEHEKFPFLLKDLSPIPYEGESSIRKLLDGMQNHLGWEPIIEKGLIIGLNDKNKGGVISLEPAGQFELSGATLTNLHETHQELEDHLAALNVVASPLGIGFLGVGTSPLWTFEKTPIMPKARYVIMREYMPKVGKSGRDMMFRTSTVQSNLDFVSESDMVKKLRVSLAIQPIATAIFANSPFLDGKPNGFLSLRSEIWKDTDKARSGMLPFAFDDGFGFEQYVDYALDVPMYFVKRGHDYNNVAGKSFRDLLSGNLAELKGERATISDWENHLSTIFPEVRLKRYLEMRGADVGSKEFIVALSAFWVGLLYDDEALDAAWQISKSWSSEERQKLRDDAPKHALNAQIKGRNILDIATELLPIIKKGLEKRKFYDAMGRDESLYLAPIEMVLDRKKTQAEIWLERFNNEWKGSVAPLFNEAVF